MIGLANIHCAFEVSSLKGKTNFSIRWRSVTNNQSKREEAMSTQKESTSLFRSLHQPGDPIILYNIWDTGSAQAVASSGAKALATGSAPVSMAQGFSDGENMPLDLALDNIRRILAAVDLPVTMDLEGGYGVETDIVAKTVSRAVATGIVGFNFEDQIVGGEGLHDISTQSTRIKAARNAADSDSVSPFINARTDIFLKAKPDTHTEAMLDDAIERAKAYEQVGADGFFAPGLADEKLIATLCEKINLPVNIIALPHVPPNNTLRELGVARISYGPVPYRHMLKALSEAAAKALV